MNDTIVAPISLNVNSNEEVVVYTKKKESKPPFQMVASKLKGQYMDALEEVANMNSDEKFCFFTIKNEMRYDYIEDMVQYKVKIPKLATQAEKNMFSRGFKLLSSKGLVKRVRRGTYMINPDLLIPSNYNYWKVKWEEI